MASTLTACLESCFGRRRKRNKSASILQNGRYSAETPHAGDLVVRSVNFMIDRNSRKHRTDKYHACRRRLSPQLVIRRGQPFDFRITFERRFRYGEDVLSLVFLVKGESEPSYSNLTEITVPVLDERNARRYSYISDHKWSARIVLTDGQSVIIEVTSSSEAIIGEYHLVIDTRSPSRQDDSFYSNPIPQSLVLLFNPWIKNDSAYHPEWPAKEEYVLNDQGIVWRGTHSQMKTTHWNYAQFDEYVLDACLYALSNVGKLPPADRNDVVKVARHIAAIVNSNDDNGIVMGSWAEDFTGGTEPTAWHGSQAILEQFLKTRRPVKFGQCWVFAGVTCTLSRCLGIPCRVVTNYMSAHDTHRSITVDRFFNADGEPVAKLNKDSIWNFHAWNEVWIKRPDLSPAGIYDGWNVIDATPQEASSNGGQYRVGPTSVQAIKLGEVNKPFDGYFVYAEVNADEVYWLYRDDKKPLKLITHSTDSVGVAISTKAELKDRRVDITANYKHKENSRSEREILMKALKLTRSHFSRYYLNEKFEDVRFELVPIDEHLVGDSFKVDVIVSNHSHKVYTIQLSLYVRSKTYTDASSVIVKREHLTKSIGPRKKSEVSTMVHYLDYADGLPGQSIFEVSVMATVVESDYQFFMASEYRLRMPDITIETEGHLAVGRPFTCHLTLVNPLPRPLTKCVFTLEGPDASTRATIPVHKAIAAKDKVFTFTILTPKNAGKKRITAKFRCKELNDIDGVLNFDVAQGEFGDNDNNNNNNPDNDVADKEDDFENEV